MYSRALPPRRTLRAVDIHDILSKHLGLTRRITVWTPPRLRRQDVRYPVLYLNDGQNLFDPARAFGGVAWGVAETAMRLIRRRAIPPLVIVGIDHGESRRAREYLPVDDERNADAHGVLGRQYARFVTREVMPIVTGEYPVARGASATGFGGSSYGAVAALFTSLLYPGMFGRLLLESPSLYVGGGYLLRQVRRARRWPARVYLGVGTRETRDADKNEETVSNVLRLERILRDAGLGQSRLRVRVEEGATHSEQEWARRFPEALAFLFGR
jgi:predicted alpha/beta superfamily hydrolase